MCVCERGHEGESLFQVTLSSLLSNTLAFSLSDLVIAFVAVENVASYESSVFIEFNLLSDLSSLTRENTLQIVYLKTSNYMYIVICNVITRTSQFWVLCRE